MNPRPSWLLLFWMMSLASVLAGPALGAESTTGTATAVFGPTDTEATAFEKIRALGSPSTSDAMAQLQLSCRDFCRQFPDGKVYYEVRRKAVIHWIMWPGPWANRGDFPKIEGWNPTDAESDERLDAEQRADIAMLLANGRASKNFDRGKTFEEREFEAVAAAVPLHRSTTTARNMLIDAAVHLPPQRKADASAALRTNYPADARAAQCVALLDQLGQPCELRFTAVDGRSVDLRDYRGKVVLLEFWSKSCGPCIQSIPDLKKLDERFAPRGFAIIGVNMDTKRADAEEIIKKHALPWPQSFDGKGEDTALAKRFLVWSIPRGVLIDREGRLRGLACDVRNSDGPEFIERLLAERPLRAER
jgi:peroxiredoxin